MSGARRRSRPDGQPVVRTTLTLAEDVALRLDQLRHQQGASFKATVNTVLRAGLDAVNRPPSGAEHCTEPLPGRLCGRIDQVWW